MTQLGGEQWLSHELRTLLSLLAAPLERLERRVGDDPKGIELLAAARGYMEVIGRLGDSVVDDDPATSAAAPPNIEHMHPAVVVANVAEQLHPMALELGISMEVVTTGASQRLVASDVRRFTRMVSTVIELSIRKTRSPGAVTVSLDAPRPGELLLSVESSTSGPDATAPHATRLSALRVALERIGGRLTTFGLPGGASVLELGYPTHDAPEATAPAAASGPDPAATREPPAAAEAPERLPVAVIVDDEPHILDIWLRTLRRRFEVHTAVNGAEGLALVQRLRPDLVLTDNVMPHMSGAELIVAMREDPTLAPTPVLAVTAAVTTGLRNAMRLPGPGAVLVKPVRPLDLLMRAEALVGAFHAERTRRSAEERDPVTGLYTGEWLRAALTPAPRRADATLVLADVRRFQDINALFGRPVGDQVLARVGESVLGAVRQQGEVAHLGNARFAVLLHGVSPAQGTEVAARVEGALGRIRPDEVAGLAAFDRTSTTRLRSTVVTVAPDASDADADATLERALLALERSKLAAREPAAA